MGTCTDIGTRHRAACLPVQDWSPGEYVRWYIDGRMLYEVNKEALRAQTNSTGALLPTVSFCVQKLA